MFFSTCTSYLLPFFKWVLQTSWQSSFFVAVIALTVFLLRKKLSAGGQYVIWLLVLVRLVLPVSISSPFSINEIPERLTPRLRNDTPVQQQTAFAQPVSPSETPPFPSSSERISINNETARQPDIVSSTTDTKSSGVIFTVLTVIASAWLAIVVVLLARLFFNHVRFSRQVIETRPVTDERIMVLLQDCKEKIGVKVPLDVVETPYVKTPSLMGVLHPRLLLPEGLLADFDIQRLRYFFLHELAHYKRGDLAVNWLLGICHILHWFNPVLLFAFSRIRLSREAACDAMVIALLNEQQENTRYGEAILHLLSHSSTNRWIPGAVGILEDKKQLKERITMIAHYKPSTGITTLLTACAVFVLAATGLTSAKQVTPTEPASDGSTAVTAPAVTANTDTQVPATDTANAPAKEDQRIVVALNPLSVSRELEQDALFINDILLAELSQQPEILVVDRDQLRNSLREMQLSEQGMISPGAAQQLGRILGASFFCSGTVSQRDDKLFIMAKIIDMETTLINSAYASFAKDTDPVQAASELANRIVQLAVKAEGDKNQAAANAAPATPAKQIPPGWKRPVVMVSIPEIHVGQPVLIDPAGETEIVKSLLAAGYTVIDSATIDVERQNDSPGGSDFLRQLLSYNINIDTDGTAVNVERSNREMAGKLRTAAEYARKKGADVLIFGEAISERGARLGQFEGCRARIELKAINTDNEQIILTDSAYGGATDLAESTAGKKAIQQAANRVSPEFVYTLCEKWNSR